MLGVFTGCVTATGPTACGGQLEEWDLPADLCQKQSQLKSLYLPPEVDDLRWLGEGLESLTLHDGKLESLSGLPDSLRRLDLAWTEVPVEVEWPAGLVALDLSGSRTGDLASLPEGLLRLDFSIGGGEILSQLKDLPDGLTHLGLEVPRVHPLALHAVPPSVTHLSLTGAGATSVDGLPEKLKSLALERTSNLEIRDLSATPRLAELVVEAAPLPIETLPRSLQTLHLQAIPPSLNVAEQVPFLGELVVTDGVLPPPRQVPAYLETLGGAVGQSYRWPSFLEDLPRSLRTLVLRGLELKGEAELEDFPAELKALGLPWCRVEGAFPSLPAGLEKLDLSFCRLDAVPAWENSGLLELNLSMVDLPDPDAISWPLRLERLTWRSHGGAAFPDVPATLEVLDLSNSTDLKALPNLEKSGLKCLSISNTGVGKLPPLPSSLLFLDISDTAIDSLKGLPDGLITLVVRRGQLTSLGELPARVENLVFTDPLAAPDQMIDQIRFLDPCSRGPATH